MTGCYLSIDFEDFSHDLQRALGVKKPKTRRDALVLSIRRIMKTVKTSPGSDRLTFFTTGQVARDHGEIIKELSDNGHEIGCHSYYHDNVHQSGRQRFASDLDKAIEVISKSSGKPVYGFRAPSFSICPEDSWAYEELSKRFLYDSSFVSETRDQPNNTTDTKIFGDKKLIEFPVFSCRILPGFNARVIGGTYLKVLPLSTIIKLMNKAIEAGFLPLIYLHPYEFLSDGEFWVKSSDLKEVSVIRSIYWQIRQNQWLTIWNKNLLYKLSEILKIFPNQGTMLSHLNEK